METEQFPLNQKPLKDWSETELENRVHQLSFDLSNFYGKEIIIKVYLQAERDRILEELTRRDEIKKK